MAWTTIPAGSLVLAECLTAEAEIEAALQERFDATGWVAAGPNYPLHANFGTSNLRSQHFYDWLTAARSFINNLVMNESADFEGRFVKPDYTTWSSLSALLNDAGYASGWMPITPGQGLIEDLGNMLRQIQDVLDIMVTYRVNPFYGQNEDGYHRANDFYTYGTDYDVDDAWSHAVGDTPIAGLTYFHIVWYIFAIDLTITPGFPIHSYEVVISGPIVTLQTNIDFTAGVCVKAEMKIYDPNTTYPVPYDDYPSGFPGLDIEDSEGNTFTITTASPYSSGPLDITSAITAGANYTYTAENMTAESGPAPWSPVPLVIGPPPGSSKTEMVAGIIAAYDGYFYFDITTALTYG